MPKPKIKPKSLNVFRLLRGTHVQKDAEGNRRKYRADGTDAGNIVETHLDLVKMFGADKFARLDAHSTGAPPVSDPLATLDIDALRELAADEEIEIPETDSKEEILAAIRAATANR